MNSLINKLTTQYQNETHFIKTKAEYTVMMFMMISVYATIALLIVIQGNKDVMLSSVVFTVYCLMMLFIWHKFKHGYLIFSQYAIFIAGVSFGFLHFGFSEEFHFYIQILLIILVSIVVYIKKSQLIIMHTILISLLVLRSIMLFIWQNDHVHGKLVFENSIFLVISIIMLILFLHAFNIVILKGIEETETLQESSEIDILTNLYNRKKFNSDMTSHKESDAQIQLCVIDIDYFKGINDSFGHSSGDVVLKQLSDILTTASCEAQYKVYRWGGEEFVVISENTSENQFEDLLEEIRHQVEIHLFSVPRRVTISIGVSSKTSNSNKLNRLFNEADDALYQAKEQGRNRIIKVGDRHE